MAILTLNCGSSSLKYQVYDWDEQKCLCVGLIERIGQERSHLQHQPFGRDKYEETHTCPTHKEAISWILDIIQDPANEILKKGNRITVVGHRIVHGGEKFQRSFIIDESAIKEIERLTPLAPLHNPANIMGIRAALSVLPEVPQCGVLDTAWHQTIRPEAFLYPLPYEWYESYQLRKYGFHGTSYLYTAKRATLFLGKDPQKTNLIVAHLGNGASLCAVKNGVSHDTSMGLTPLAGLMMGTRSGDIDPGIPRFIMEKTGKSIQELETVLNVQSGVRGVTKQYSDRRDVQEGIKRGQPLCVLAESMETYRIRKFIGAYLAALGRVDALVFTAGVGEMNPIYRERSLTGLESLGIILDPEKNRLSKSRNAETCISSEDSPIKIFVIPTDEELVIAEDSWALVQGSYDTHTRYTYSFENPNYVNKVRQAGLQEDLAKEPRLKSILLSGPSSS